MLVTVGNWASSTTTSHYDRTITASAYDIKTRERHWIDGKVWKYRTWEELDKIRKFIDKLKLKHGILKEYQS